MDVQIVRLEDVAPGAAFWAEQCIVHRLRYLPRDFVDVVTVISGQGEHLVRSRPPGPVDTACLEPGTVVVYRPGDDVTLIAHSSTGMTLRSVSFPIAEWRDLAEIAGLDSTWIMSGGPPRVAPGPETAALPTLFEDAIRCAESGARPLDLVRLWAAMAAHILPTSGTRAPRPSAPGWLLASVEAMSEEANLRGGVGRLRELAHVSAQHLSTMTRRYFGTTPSALVMKLRLRRAALLLDSTDESVGLVARRCGFASFAYFSTSFRREYLLPPRDYRARKRVHATVGQTF